jgi:hypothetical protein
MPIRAAGAGRPRPAGRPGGPGALGAGRGSPRPTGPAAPQNTMKMVNDNRFHGQLEGAAAGTAAARRTAGRTGPTTGPGPVRPAGRSTGLSPSLSPGQACLFARTARSGGALGQWGGGGLWGTGSGAVCQWGSWAAGAVAYRHCIASSRNCQCT